MAKATAICTCKTCGKTFEMTATKSNMREARRWEAWAEETYTECYDCETERKARENEEAAKASGWAALEVGSPRQISWANNIRHDLMDQFFALGDDEIWFRSGMRGADPEMPGRILKECAERFMAEHLDARYWIDNRSGYAIEAAIVAMATEAMKAEEAKAEEAEEATVEETSTENVEAADNAAPAQPVTVAEPQEKRHDGTVEITFTDKLVAAKYRKDDAFRSLAKNLSFVWDSNTLTWRLPIGPTTGAPRDRAAELGNHLLNAGFAIRIADPEVLTAAVSGSYEPMTFRWISALQPQECFFIKWAYSDDLYSEAKSLPGARYVKPGVTVPSSEYRAVMDFASTYGFRFTPGAQALISRQQAATRVVEPAPARKPEYDERPLAAILDSSCEVLDDLKDDNT